MVAPSHARIERGEVAGAVAQAAIDGDGLLARRRGRVEEAVAAQHRVALAIGVEREEVVAGAGAAAVQPLQARPAAVEQEAERALVLPAGGDDPGRRPLRAGAVAVQVQRVAVAAQVAEQPFVLLALAVGRRGREVVVPRPLAAVDRDRRDGRRRLVVGVALAPQHRPALAAGVEREEAVGAGVQAVVDRVRAGAAVGGEQVAEVELERRARADRSRRDDVRARAGHEEAQQRLAVARRIAQQTLGVLAFAAGVRGGEVVRAPGHDAAVDRHGRAVSRRACPQEPDPPQSGLSLAAGVGREEVVVGAGQAGVQRLHPRAAAGREVAERRPHRRSPRRTRRS